MNLDPDTCYLALRARDRRFDGVFFVGVSTTGIYCRPICPARTPSRERCAFFAHSIEAERAGFRACLRCRPELAPGRAQVDSIPRLLRKAVARIESGYLNERSVDALAEGLGVSARHLRRAMESALGVSPVELAQARRLALAKQLLQDTDLPLAQVAFAAGFRSVRRCNALFQERFGRPPSALRVGPGAPTDFITLRLDYRPPLHYEALLGFLAGRAIPGVESVSLAEGVYERQVALGPCRGALTVRQDPGRPALLVRLSTGLLPRLMEICARLRALFDLDARPDQIDEHLIQSPLLAPLVRARPGLRVPGAFCGFELGVRVVLGQQVTVRAANTLCARLVEHFGGFPAPARLAAADAGELAALGMPRSRGRALQELARAVAAGTVELQPGADPDETRAALEALPGIGPWTAQYITLRALKWPDAFPDGDLVLRRVLGAATSREAERLAAPFSPYRAYAALHLWTSVSAAAGG